MALKAVEVGLKMLIKLNFNYIVLLSSLLIGACGSSENTENKKVSVSTSSNQSSSNSSVAASEVDFIFPTVKANINGADKTRVILRVKLNDSQTNDVTGVHIGDIALEQEGNFWVTSDQELQLASGVAEQVFPVSVETSNGTVEAAPLILSTHVSGSAGSGGPVSATGLAFNKLNSDLYVSDSVNKNIQKLDSASGERSVIYQQEGGISTSLMLFWSFIVDGFNNTIYLMADRAELDSNTAAHKYVTELVTINTENHDALVQSIDSVSDKNKLYSARNIISDIDGSLPVDIQSGKAAIYAIDFLSSTPLKRIIVDEDSLAYGYSYSVNPQNISEELNTLYSSAYGPSALVRDENRLILSRESSDVNGIEAGSLIEIVFTEEDVFGEKTITTVANAYASLADDGARVSKPSALAFNHDKTLLYIADNRRIWEMDLTVEGYQKPLRLISSSNIIPQKLGDGPDLATSITAIEFHPDYNILYMASGERGVMALDVSTGNRITVAK